MLQFNTLKSAATLVAFPAALHQKFYVGAMAASTSAEQKGTDCHGQVCHPVEQFCYHFDQACLNCSMVCDPLDARYERNECTQQCSEFLERQQLKNEIHQIQMQQNIILYLLVLLLIITCVHYTWKCLKWLRHKRCLQQIVKKFKLKKNPGPPTAHLNGKDAVGGTTIQNMCAINDIERAPSQIYSMTGAEGSVMTMTTPISSRHPAENTTPSPQPNEYSYDNQALAVTPISEKPGGSAVF